MRHLYQGESREGEAFLCKCWVATGNYVANDRDLRCTGCAAPAHTDNPLSQLLKCWGNHEVRGWCVFSVTRLYEEREPTTPKCRRLAWYFGGAEKLTFLNRFLLFRGWRVVLQKLCNGLRKVLLL